MPLSSANVPSRRPSLHTPLPTAHILEFYSDARTHGYQGPSRHVRIPHATPYGGGSIAKNEEGTRCVVAGKESLRILRIPEPVAAASPGSEHKPVIDPAGHRVEVSRNFWDGSGLKIDSASTDVTWCHGTFSNKIITSARNGELIMWDVNKSGGVKYERRVRDSDQFRSIHQIAYSTILPYMCCTGSADGFLRMWDLRDLSKPAVRILHRTAPVRSIAVSPVVSHPFQAITGLDNGNIHRWDLRAGQLGNRDRISVAHAGAVLSLDWAPSTSLPSRQSISSQSGNWYGGVGSGLFEDLSGHGGAHAGGDTEGSTLGWLASGGLDRCVKVWDLTIQAPEMHISRHPMYTLHTSSPVRRVLWRPGYECELAVVSNVDIGTGPSSNLHTASSHSANTTATSTISATASAAPSPLMGFAKPPESVGMGEDRSSTPRNESGHPIEIWDVRREYIAKWHINGSAIDGGVTDVVFCDSHALWAQHMAGSFSQLDLRQSSRPLDAIPRVAATWDAAGSILFVADRPRKWEIPYDDINVDKKTSIPIRRAKRKGLGDKPYMPTRQTLGTLAGDGFAEDVVSFVKLAQSYIFEGIERDTICARNAEFALEVGKHDAAQAWLLLQSLLTDLSSLYPPPLPPLPLVGPELAHSASAPVVIPSTVSQNFPVSQPLRSLSVDSNRASKEGEQRSASRHSDDKMTTEYLSPRKTTPASSTNSSPRRMNSPLPSLPASIFARRGSNSGLPALPSPMRPRLSSSIRRPSFTTQSIFSAHSESPTESTRSHVSLRHVGDGALDDSDSSGESDGGPRSASCHDSDDVDESFGEPNIGSSNNNNGGKNGSTGEFAASLRQSISPYLYPRSTMAQPSPLSRVAGQQTWTEDEKEDEDSPSPASTDSESDSGGRSNAGMRKASKRNSTTRSRPQNRSRSSTVASLSVSASAAVSTPVRPTLKRQDSQSSIRTVTAGTTPTPEKERGGLDRDDTVRDLSGRRSRAESSKNSPYRYHQRMHSAISSELILDPESQTEGKVTRTQSSTRGAHAREAARSAERRYCEAGWDALRETFEVFADEGDVQTCTMLALVAPEELKVSNQRLLRFLDSYIEMLVRLRLHTSAAYLRKHAPVDEVRNTTGRETIIYTSCGHCRKPMVVPGSAPTHAGKPSGSYAFCLACRSNSAKCSICHLPVRALLFKCPVCMHGGHQACYESYYRRRPTVELTPASSSSVPSHPLPLPPVGRTSVPPTPDLRMRGRASSRSGEAEGSDDGFASVRDGDEIARNGAGMAQRGVGAGLASAVYGHPCAAGCGHFCWATNGVGS